MSKAFYTEEDIEDLVKRGILSLEIDDNIVLTELAYEKANRLGMKLVRGKSESSGAANVRIPAVSSSTPSQPTKPDLAQRIRSAVTARMGSQIDSNLLDDIIVRVLTSTGLK